MLQQATADNPAFEICENELDRKGTSYTVDTIRELREQFGPQVELFLLIGGDNYAIFQFWREPDTIMKACRIVVYKRPGTPVTDISDPFITLAGPQFDLASSWLREQCAAGNSIRYCVTEPVRKYIEEHRLYSNPIQPLNNNGEV